MLIDIKTVANYILATHSNHTITPMKLQKLAYYTKVWTLVAGAPIVNAEFKKWAYGPVNTTLFHTYKSHGRNPIPAEPTTKVSIDTASSKLIDFIVDNYIAYSAFELSAMTHSERPWVNTPLNQTIPDQEIIAYYATQPFAKNFSDGTVGNGMFHVLQTESWHAFTLDMLPSDVESMETFPSYDVYASQSERAAVEFESFMETLFDGR